MQKILEDKTQLAVLIFLTLYILSDIKTPRELAIGLSSFLGI